MEGKIPLERANQKDNKDKKYECSYGDCVLSFAMRSQLLKHYRYSYHDFVKIIIGVVSPVPVQVLLLLFKRIIYMLLMMLLQKL